MVVLYILLLVGAAVCFLLAAFFATAVGTRTTNRGRAVDLVALGLFFWVLVELIQEFQRV